jgi:two-component system KDP operon response regulator KdpE
MTKKIIILHTDFREGNQIKDTLNKEPYEAATTYSVKDCRDADMVLICKDSFNTSVISGLRKQFSAPIIVFSSDNNEKDIVEALDAGAHDFLTLPLGTPEHMARIRAAFRNSAAQGGSTSGIFSQNGLEIDFQSRTVISDNQQVHLTPIEFRILTLLIKNQGTVLSHEQIISDIWGPFNSDNLVLRVNIANIRKKIEPDPGTPKHLLTQMGVGYYVKEGM